MDKEFFLNERYPAMNAQGNRIDELLGDIKNVAAVIQENNIESKQIYTTLAKVIVQRCEEIEDKKSDMFSILYNMKNELEDDDK